MPLMAATSPLVHHPSPYLAMHADDPVHWQLWNEAVLQRAQQEHRLILISSGYFACHWCHVMQQQSFRNRVIAERLNNNFIAVKIDRELWPELDAYLIDFVEKTRGAAGWPLNVFLTPEGYPLVGTTYLPPEGFAEFLQRLEQRWQSDASNLTALARAAATASSRATRTSTPTLSQVELKNRLLQALLQQWDEQADHFAGGFGSEAKFPQVPLLSHILMLKDETELNIFIRITLDSISAYGLQDHLGGGFFRYTVDPGWKLPHFEKMLSDNAQLAALYLQAGKRFKDKRYHQIGMETLNFMLREMHHPDGAFVASLSAVDAKGEEGGYYLWTEEELRSALGDKDAKTAASLWSMQGVAPWDNGYLPVPKQGLSQVTKEKQESLKLRLLSQRQKRSLPRDMKRLAGWNGLALIALSDASNENKHYLNAGKEVRDYLHSLWDGNRMWRVMDDKGKRWLPGGLGDYAFTALGLMKWDAAVGDRNSRELAAELVTTAWRRFHNEAGWLPGGEAMLIGRREPVVPDGAVPSAAIALFEANLLLGEKGPIKKGAMIQALTAQPLTLLNEPLAYSGYLTLLQRLHGE